MHIAHTHNARCNDTPAQSTTVVRRGGRGQVDRRKGDRQHTTRHWTTMRSRTTSWSCEPFHPVVVLVEDPMKKFEAAVVVTIRLLDGVSQPHGAGFIAHATQTDRWIHLSFSWQRTVAKERRKEHNKLKMKQTKPMRNNDEAIRPTYPQRNDIRRYSTRKHKGGGHTRGKMNGDTGA